MNNKHEREKQEKIKKLKKDYQELKRDYLNAKLNGLEDRLAWESMELIVLELRKLGAKL